MKKTIALFGATGATGKEFLNLALQQNYLIQALVRSPEKISSTDPNLHLIKGDFSDKEAISNVIKNSDYVVCFTGSLKSPEKDLMFNFIELLHSLMLEQNVRNLIYQAGALCYLPNKKKSLSIMLMRNTIGRITGFETSLADHDKVLAYLDSNMIPDGFNVIVTLPGAAGLNHSSSQKKLEIQSGVIFTPSTYIDVATFTLNNLSNFELFGKFIYIA